MDAKILQKYFKILCKQLIKRKKITEAILEKILIAPYQSGTLQAWQEFLMTLVTETRQILAEERETNILNGSIYKINTKEECVVIGDTHGDIDSFLTVVKKEDLLSNKEKKTILLGDYIDRGPMQLSTLALALLLKVVNRDNVFVLRGNHEEWNQTQEGLIPAVKGDEDELFLPFWKKHLGEDLFDEIYHLFQEMPVLVELNGQIGLVHGGLPRPTDGMNDYKKIENLESLNEKNILYEMRWSRPENKEDVIITGSSSFSTALIHFNNFTEKLGWKSIIRGHCPVGNGYELLSVYDNRLITIHSTGCNPNIQDTDEPCSNTDYAYINPVYLKVICPDIEIWRVFHNEMVKRLMPRGTIVEY